MADNKALHWLIYNPSLSYSSHSDWRCAFDQHLKDEHLECDIAVDKSYKLKIEVLCTASQFTELCSLPEFITGGITTAFLYPT
jgi:hypothetical protein